MFYLEEKKCDIVLLDVALKQGNGFSVCKEIKEKYRLPVIFLTASDDEYSVVTGLDLGADDYVGKPFRPRELVSRIHSVLRRCRAAVREPEYHTVYNGTNEKGECGRCA